jgi:hypothetical protein
MTAEAYIVVGVFKNETAVAMSLYLEMVPEEVILDPGDEVELLARPSEHLLPLDVAPVEGGLIYMRTTTGTRTGMSGSGANSSRPAIRRGSPITADAGGREASDRLGGRSARRVRRSP